MFRVMGLLTKKPGMTREEFIERYENFHVPLALRLFPEMKEYSRRYVDEGSDSVGFDVVTELAFDDYAGFRSMYDRLENDPEVARLITEDEEMTFDRSKTTRLLVTQIVSR